MRTITSQDAYPLTWPDGYPRCQDQHMNWLFKCTLAQARDGVVSELRRLGATEIIISSNVPVKQNGLLYADWQRRNIDDTGIAVYFNYQKEQRVLCCDKWMRLEHNLRAIEKTVEAMRGLDRWGVSEMLNRIFSGFTALPEASQRKWWVVLGVDHNCTPEQVKEAYRLKVLETHPDKGGDTPEFIEVQQAYEQFTKQLESVIN